jgi:hypothetical protein
LHRSTLAALLSFGTRASHAQALNAAKPNSLLNSLAANDKLLGSLFLSPEGGTVVVTKA